MIDTTLIDSGIHTTFIYHGILRPWLNIKVTLDTLNLLYLYTVHKELSIIILLF